jgi:hypothetical protein
VPTRKQRRRQAKAKRHEYEYVLVDEEGHESPVDPAELRAEKQKDKPAVTREKQAPPRDRRGRPLREPRKPSWQRAIRMGLIFVAVLFVVTSFIGSKQPPLAARILMAVAYGAVGIPFFYFIDRATYRRWERLNGPTSDAKR